MLVIDIKYYEIAEVDEHEAFAMQLRGTHQLLHKNAEYSYRYARNVLDKPFPLGEAAIATHEWFAFKYARDVLRKPFPLGEPAIANSADCSLWYARDILQARFPLGEAAIAKDEIYSSLYASSFNLRLIDGVFQPC